MGVCRHRVFWRIDDPFPLQAGYRGPTRTGCVKVTFALSVEMVSKLLSAFFIR
jgi:hypothetical protein